MLGKGTATGGGGNHADLILTIDDKGLFPSDGIYTGTISPPRPELATNIYWVFNIQWYRSLNDTSGNGRVFRVDSDSISFSDDGTRWFVDINHLANWVTPPQASHFEAAGAYELTISVQYAIEDFSPEKQAIARRQYIVDSPSNCEATILEIPDLIIPNIGQQYQYSYRVNGGEIVTSNENAGGENAQIVITNILAYYGFFNDLVTNGTGKKAFRAKYGEPVKGGSLTDPNFVQAQSNTIELLLTEGAEHDLIKTIFGHAVTIHSCAIVDWK